MVSDRLDARVRQEGGFERHIVAGDGSSSSTGCPKAGVEPRLAGHCCSSTVQPPGSSVEWYLCRDSLAFIRLYITEQDNAKHITVQFRYITMQGRVGKYSGVHKKPLK
jgi:ABC-type cobalamin transport system ATPase subunit